ncbi:hypothetical protein K439DRAFT_1610352 [Ramaria rubella]|nr:hypothetical protein K439DRAFT_1610352 [Ramaria rubella]
MSESQLFTWENILKEEPFEGQHWQGAYGLPGGSVVQDWTGETSDSDGSSLLYDAEYEENMSSSEEEHPQSEAGLSAVAQQSIPQALRADHGRSILQAIREFETDNIGNRGIQICIHLQGATLDRILLYDTALPQRNSFINEVDAVREVLMVLQGRQSCLFEGGPGHGDHQIKVLLDRRIPHLSYASQASILGTFSALASILNPLRQLVGHTFSRTSIFGYRCRTFEAFSAAVEHQIRKFDLWCAGKEECINFTQQGGSSPDHITSLLNLKQEVVFFMAETFHVLLDVFHTIACNPERLTPSTMSALILNTLLDAIRARLVISDAVTASALLDVWRESVEPIWSNLGRWLKDGIPIQAGSDDEPRTAEPTWDKEEFFIRINPLLDIGSPEFWEGSYTLLPCHDAPNPQTLKFQCQADASSLPSFLRHISEDILATGKAVGLLRAIDMIHLVGRDWLGEWTNFKHLTETLLLSDLEGTLTHLIYDTLLTPCRLAQSWLRQVLVEEYAMSQFSERLFARMDSRQPWNDFHFLNTAFREVTRFGSNAWIDASLVRFTHRGSKDRNVSRTVRAIDGLAIEYAIPFPLTYLFGPESSSSYSSLFCFLLQIRRSKSVLDGVLVRKLNNDILGRTPDLKVFYVLRSKLSWFVNTFMNFVVTNVIHAGLLDLHKALQDAESLDQMISVHRFHLERLLGRCLLQPNTSALHRAILDMRYKLGCLASLFDIDETSLFKEEESSSSSPCAEVGYSSSDSDNENVGADLSAVGSSVSVTGDDFFARQERIHTELDGLLRFIRRGVESLAAGTGDASATFGVLAFCLEDWEL